ncbi:uncharacterized protein LOC122058582 isoform X2 [Macadamia integrifolia]|uniref:uncharacterized protein LOC122058582 isoform X2 n=1 Tax=Macadamia integrifolia TaxID=60698 RepID=UPI001C5310F2|nr:uncharacterized protein LOC122058582 isoform X2 [Macadamia integrifolia]
MADVGNTDILSEIQALVSDKLQVVSYKWLSRNFTVSSNDSKRLLLEFVKKHGSGLEVVYTLSGWLKNDPPPVYHIRLVSGSKLAEVKQEFEDNCSVQVYSVQACIPKDPAVLWNAEFVQAEELFNQPSTVDNCLRDNRYCGVSNSFVKRNAKETPPVFVPPQRNNSGVTGPSKSSSANQTPFVPQPQEGKIQQVSPKIGLQSTTVASNDVKNEHSAREVHAHTTKPHMDKEKGTAFPANKKTAQNDKGSSGTGGSLASLWGRASTKSKPSCPPAETNNVVPNTSEAQICAHEAVDAVSSDDEGQIIKHKRASNGEGSRKRRVVFDFSDEENEDAVNLASPDPPKRQSSPDSKHNKKSSVLDTNNLDFEEQKEENPKVKQEKITERDSSLWREDPVANQKKPGISLLDKSDNAVPKNDLNKKEKTTEAAPNSPKRRKVLKTRIDERGREVTEVVWEDEGAESKTTEKNPVNNVNNRPPATKSPAVGAAAPSIPAGKAGNKKAGKGGVKDPKQGNIMSFFKRV